MPTCPDAHVSRCPRTQMPTCPDAHVSHICPGPSCIYRPCRINDINQFRQVIQSAFTYWEKNSDIRFTEVDQENIAEIKISFVNPGPHNNCPMEMRKGTAKNKVYAHANFPPDQNDETTEHSAQNGLDIE